MIKLSRTAEDAGQDGEWPPEGWASSWDPLTGKHRAPALWWERMGGEGAGEGHSDPSYWGEGDLGDLFARFTALLAINVLPYFDESDPW